MMQLKLILPTKKYEESYNSLIKEAYDYGDYKEMGNSLIRDNETFNLMLKRVNNRRFGKNIAKCDVPSTIYWIIFENEIVGTIDLRHKLNKSYFEKYGHIAYYIKPSKRNNKIATNALKLALNKYKKMYLKKILITCYNDNIFSKKVILKNGGILDSKVIDNDTNKIICKYIITLNDDSIVIPKVAWLTTNRNCNNKCNWCYTINSRKNFMDFNKLKDCVKELHKININKIILIGGEPTMYNYIYETIKYINSLGIDVSMASNGRMFSDYNFAKKMVKAGLKNCNISIKGANEKEYLENTKTYGFNEMVKGYNNLKKLNINVSTSYVLYDKDLSKFDIFWDSFLKNKLDNITFQLFKPTAEKSYEVNDPTINDLAEICEYVFNKIKNSGINFTFEMSIPLCSLNGEILSEMINKNCLSTCCHMSKGKGIVFDEKFDILPCNHFVGHSLNISPISLNSIISFWNSEVPVKFRKILKTYPSEICSNCTLWKKCGGGCHLRWLSSSPKDYINKKYIKGGE